MSKQAEQFMGRIEELIINWRRHLHQYPELSFQEAETSRWIAGQLEQLGCQPLTNIGGHGIIVTIDSHRPGPTVALRADIDALPIQDEKDCTYRSRHSNVMHACGHDGHTAALLAIAAYYQDNKDWVGVRKLIFQPAEEVSPGGAASMIKAGALQGVDVIYGVHLWTPLDIGSCSSVSGAFMSTADEFIIDIFGKGGHGGLPHQSVDAIIAGTALVHSVQTIVSRNVNPLQPAVITIGSIHAGSAPNVIAERCQLKGTIRSFDEPTRQYMQHRLEDVIQHVCALYQTEYKYELREGYPTLVNNKEETQRFFEVARAQFGEENTIEAQPITIAEDFSYYLQQIPGCFMFVGAGNDAAGASYPHHHPMFDIDERAIAYSARLLIGMAESYCAEHK